MTAAADTELDASVLEELRPQCEMRMLRRPATSHPAAGAPEQVGACENAAVVAARVRCDGCRTAWLRLLCDPHFDWHGSGKFMYCHICRGNVHVTVVWSERL